jgi:GAF domain-containing protein
MELNQLLARMAVKLADAGSTEDAIETVVHYGRNAVNADDAGVLLVHGRGRVETPAATSKEVDEAHQLQAEYGEGPCLDSVKGGDTIYKVDNVLADPRWPRWGKAAAEMGYFSVVSASLQTETRAIGSLNVYSRRMDAFGDADVDVLGLLADHAAAAIAGANVQENLRRALDSRTMIGQAQGILMSTYDLDAETAFSYMRRLSQDHNQKLVGVAKSIIERRPQAAKPAKDAGVPQE